MNDLINRLRGKYSCGPNGVCEDRDFGTYTPQINREAADHIINLENALTEVMRLLKNGSGGAITDTVWSDSLPNTTLYELIYNLIGKKEPK